MIKDVKEKVYIQKFVYRNKYNYFYDCWQYKVYYKKGVSYYLKCRSTTNFQKFTIRQFMVVGNSVIVFQLKVPVFNI